MTSQSPKIIMSIGHVKAFSMVQTPKDAVSSQYAACVNLYDVVVASF